MRIPEIQTRLKELSTVHDMPELLALSNHLNRRRAVRRGDVVSTPMTDEVRDEIRALHAASPYMPFNRIAASLDINPGRVSETLRGFRK